MSIPIFAQTPALYTDPSTTIETYKNMVSSPESQLSLNEKEMIRRVQFSVLWGEYGRSKITNDIINLEGMSSAKIRHLLNNMGNFPGTRYLEIGCWKGSTFISALFHNKENIISASAIDNWSEFGGPYTEFQINCKKYITDIPYTFYLHDCFKVLPNTFIKEKINVYFYDGGHSTRDQANAFLFFNNVLDDVFIAMVDDWNWQQVRDGTFKAFDTLGYKVLYETSLPARFAGDKDLWWNGFYVAVIRKKK
jgi:hypothetical protein